MDLFQKNKTWLERWLGGKGACQQASQLEFHLWNLYCISITYSRRLPFDLHMGTISSPLHQTSVKETKTNKNSEQNHKKPKVSQMDF